MKKMFVRIFVGKYKYLWLEIKLICQNIYTKNYDWTETRNIFPCLKE